MTYTTLRGRVSKTRPLREIPDNERRQILIDYQTMPRRVIREKYNIDNGVISHIKYHYEKDLLSGVETPALKIRRLKEEGYTSGQVAEITGIALVLVNKMWPGSR